MSRDPLVVGHVVGDIVDPFVTTASLRVFYNSKEMTNGSELKPSQVLNQPRIYIEGRDMRTLYTLVSMIHSSVEVVATIGSSFLKSLAFYGLLGFVSFFLYKT
jgi:protein FLOWERING LOCUS T